MTFEEAMQEAARTADNALHDVIGDYNDGLVTDEDDISGAVIGALRSSFQAKQIGGLKWNASVLRHRKGVAAEEKKIGADMMFHVRLNTPTQSYSKGMLLQAKRFEPQNKMNRNQSVDLISQCTKMLGFSPASFVIIYASSGARCASASRIAGATGRNLHALCNLTSYRFFLEFFRCTTGDPRVTSALARELLVPKVIVLKASGELSPEV